MSFPNTESTSSDRIYQGREGATSEVMLVCGWIPFGLPQLLSCMNLLSIIRSVPLASSGSSRRGISDGKSENGFSKPILCECNMGGRSTKAISAI